MTIQDGLVSIMLHIHSSFVLMRDFKYIPSIAALLAVGWPLQTLQQSNSCIGLETETNEYANVFRTVQQDGSSFYMVEQSLREIRWPISAVLGDKSIT